MRSQDEITLDIVYTLHPIIGALIPCEELLVKLEAEIEMIQLQAKEHQGLPTITRSWEA